MAGFGVFKYYACSGANQPLDFMITFRAFRNWLISYILEFFKGVAASLAFVFVCGHIVISYRDI
jgi:hypothetical protein